MTLSDIMKELEAYGNEQTKKTLMNHGAKEPFFGVKVADLKKILKKTKKNHELSLALYETGNSDAMYLAGLMADESQITEAQLDDWVDKAYWYYLSEYAVPWVAAETPYGFVIAIASYISALTEKSKTLAEEIGKVSVDVGGTACKVPLATDQIKKVEDRGSLGKKRKTARC